MLVVWREKNANCYSMSCVVRLLRRVHFVSLARDSVVYFYNRRHECANEYNHISMSQSAIQLLAYLTFFFQQEIKLVHIHNGHICAAADFQADKNERRGGRRQLKLFFLCCLRLLFFIRWLSWSLIKAFLMALLTVCLSHILSSPCRCVLEFFFFEVFNCQVGETRFS